MYVAPLVPHVPDWSSITRDVGGRFPRAQCRKRSAGLHAGVRAGRRARLSPCPPKVTDEGHVIAEAHVTRRDAGPDKRAVSHRRRAFRHHAVKTRHRFLLPEAFRRESEVLAVPSDSGTARTLPRPVVASAR
jgi:hypothetical protein